jgi:sortase A
MEGVRLNATGGGRRRLERFLWVAGLCLVAGWAAVRTYGSWSAKRDVARFEAAVATPPVATLTSLTALRPVDMSRWSESRKRHYDESRGLDVGPALAVLRIDRLGLEVPVLEGTSELTLDRAAGHIEGTPLPGSGGNVGLAGHRDGFFRVLEDISEGDVLTLHTPSETLTYVVDRLSVVPPSDVSVLDPTDESVLTLVTCYPFHFVGSAPERFIVRAVRR